MRPVRPGAGVVGGLVAAGGGVRSFQRHEDGHSDRLARSDGGGRGRVPVGVVVGSWPRGPSGPGEAVLREAVLREAALPETVQ